jgi:hypothetical protein
MAFALQPHPIAPGVWNPPRQRGAVLQALSGLVSTLQVVSVAEPVSLHPGTAIRGRFRGDSGAIQRPFVGEAGGP